MYGTASDQPMPTLPLPAPVLYASSSEGCTPARPGGNAIGTENEAVPAESSGANDSPMPSIEPSAPGREMACGVTADFASPEGSARSASGRSSSSGEVSGASPPDGVAGSSPS